MPENENERRAAQRRIVGEAERSFRDDPRFRAILILVHTIADRTKAPLSLVAADVHRIGEMMLDEDQNLGAACLALASIFDDWVAEPPIDEAREARRVRLETELDRRLLRPLKE